MSIKNLIFIALQIGLCLRGYSQISQYETPIQQASPTQQSSGLQPFQLPYDNLKYALEKRQNEYDNAKAYADRLYDFISETSRNGIDAQLRNELKKIQSDLDVIYDGDMSRAGNELDKIKRRISSAIDDYNDRIKANNQRANKIETLQRLMGDKKFGDAIDYINANINDLIKIDAEFIYDTRGYCYRKLGKYTQAAADYTTLILYTDASSKDLPRAFEKRAWAYLDAENYDAGYSDGEHLTSLQPNNAEGYFIMGYALNAQKRPKEAIEKYTQAIKLNPSHSMAFNNRGYEKFTLGLDINDALKDVTKAVELDPENPFALGSRAEINIKLGRYTAAIMDLNKSLKIREHGFDFYLRGNAKIKLNDKIGACADWSKAGELNEMKAYDQILKYCK